MKWTEEKEKYIVDNWETKSVEEICSHLEISWSAVWAKAKRLNLPKRKTGRFANKPVDIDILSFMEKTSDKLGVEKSYIVNRCIYLKSKGLI